MSGRVVRNSSLHSNSRGTSVTQGDKLDDGCSREDYRITVGVANCTIVEFASNEITCEPPTNKPQVNATPTRLSLCDDSPSALALVVSLTPYKKVVVETPHVHMIISVNSHSPSNYTVSKNDPICNTIQ